MRERPGFLRPARRTRAGDIAGYAVAVVILVGGGAVFTRGILTFSRGPVFAVAAIVLVGWSVDSLRRRARQGADTTADTAEDAAQDAAEVTAAEVTEEDR